MTDAQHKIFVRDGSVQCLDNKDKVYPENDYSMVLQKSSKKRGKKRKTSPGKKHLD